MLDSVDWMGRGICKRIGGWGQMIISKNSAIAAIAGGIIGIPFMTFFSIKTFCTYTKDK